MSPDLKYRTIEEVAELLGVRYQLIYKLVRAGDLPAIRIGRVYRITDSDLDAYLESKKTQPAPAGGVCSACGKTYKSSLSLVGECSECGEPICVDCLERKGETTCTEHSKKGK